MKYFVLLLSLLWSVGCGAGYPYFAYKDFSGWYGGNESNLKGDPWRATIYERIADGADGRTKYANERMDQYLKEVMKRDIARLLGMQHQGAEFKVSISEGGNVNLDVSKKPERGVTTELLLKTFSFVQESPNFNLMFLDLNSIKSEQSDEIIDRVFGTIAEMQEIETTKESPIRLPGDVSVDQYHELLSVLLVRLERNNRARHALASEVMAIQAAIVAIDSRSRGSVENVALVVDAVLQDRRAEQAIPEAIAKFPPPREKLQELLEQSKKYRQQIEATDEFKKWKNSSHAGRQLTSLGESIGSAATGFSGLWGSVGGVDFVAKAKDQMAKGLGAELFLEAALQIAPSGSKIRSIIERGKEVQSAISKGKEIVENGNIASAASGALLWAAPEDVRKAHERLQSAGF